jgi:23S rRNA (guanine745-N1)-methyltransferase
MNNNHFICPICRTKLSLSENGRCLLCQKEEKPHCFDISSAGYVNLLTGHGGGGDSKECVKSRSAFLDSGHYAPISEKICELLRNILRGECVILDAGCGEGYYTSAISGAFPDSYTYGIDISKPAVEYAAKRAKREGHDKNMYAVSSIFELPIADEVLDCITCIFAPCPENEFRRVLNRNGMLIVASAGKNHLMGMKKAIYDTVYPNEERADLPAASDFELVAKETLSYTAELKKKDDIANLFSMTPYYYRTSLAGKERLLSLESLVTEVEVDFSIYRKI